MVTRGKSGCLKPRVFLAYSEPVIVKQALSQPHWFEAIQKEYNALMAKHTWTLTTLPSHRKEIG